MDARNYINAVSEAKVLTDLVFRGFDVFSSTTGKTPFDLVAHKDGKLLKIQVKSVSKQGRDGNYEVGLKSVKHNKTRNLHVPLNPNSCDILAIYVLELDKICYLNPKTLTSFNSIRLRQTSAKRLTKNSKQYLLTDLTFESLNI